MPKDPNIEAAERMIRLSGADCYLLRDYLQISSVDGIADIFRRNNILAQPTAPDASSIAEKLADLDARKEAD